MNTLTIAWRNIWRHKLRSLTVMCSVLLGISAGIYAAALMKGMLEGRFDHFIENEISHMQVHHPDFVREPEPAYTVATEGDALQALQGLPGVSAATARLKVHGMIASANYTGGVQLIGILPEMEEATTGFSDKLMAGENLSSDDGNRILIGYALAQKMKVDIGSRIVLTFQDVDQEIVSAAFTVKGFFQTISNRYDEGVAFVPAAYLGSHLRTGRAYHEYAILAEGMDRVEDLRPGVEALFPGMRVRSWDQLSPELSFWLEAGGVVSYAFIIIILLGLTFGLLNTMLMTVFERTRELGMLMAIGMNKRKVFALIVMETLLLAVSGAVLGLGIGYGLVRLSAKNGIDLSALSDVMRELGFSSIIIPDVDTTFLLLIPVMVVITALLAAVYPALKALSLNPAEAVRE